MKKRMLKKDFETWLRLLDEELRNIAPLRGAKGARDWRPCA